jgi:hypothetical protein
MNNQTVAARGFNHSKDGLAVLEKSAQSATEEGQQAALNRVTEEVRRLGLERNVGELSLLGYTVVPPEQVASADFIRTVRDTVLEGAHRRSGIKPDLATGKGHDQLTPRSGR